MQFVDFTREKYCEEAIKCPTWNEHKNFLKFSQSGPSNFALNLEKNALVLNQSGFSNFALYMIGYD